MSDNALWQRINELETSTADLTAANEKLSGEVASLTAGRNFARTHLHEFNLAVFAAAIVSPCDAAVISAEFVGTTDKTLAVVKHAFAKLVGERDAWQAERNSAYDKLQWARDIRQPPFITLKETRELTAVVEAKDREIKLLQAVVDSTRTHFGCVAPGGDVAGENLMEAFDALDAHTAAIEALGSPNVGDVMAAERDLGDHAAGGKEPFGRTINSMTIPAGTLCGTCDGTYAHNHPMVECSRCGRQGLAENWPFKCCTAGGES